MENQSIDYLKDLTDESSIFGDHLLSPGKKITDLIKKDNYEIKLLTKSGVVLGHKPYFRSEQKKDIEIGYDELVTAFETNHFAIDGFMPTTEHEQKNVDGLKKVILNTIKNVELEERENAIKSRELQLEQKEKEKEKLRDNHEQFVENVVGKRKSKKLVKDIRTEEESRRKEEKRLADEQARQKSFEQELERTRIEREKNLKLALAKKVSQDQRARLVARENFKNSEVNNDGNN